MGEDDEYEGRNWFDTGILGHISPSLLRRLAQCEIREEFIRKLRKSSRHRNEPFIPKVQPGEVFHHRLWHSIHEADGGEYKLFGELELPSVLILGRYLVASADRIDRDRKDCPKRIFEYKSGRKRHIVFESDHVQPLTIGLALEVLGRDISGLRYSIVFADYNCGKCPEVVAPTHHDKEYSCRGDLCEEQNKLTSFDFPYDSKRAWSIVRDELDYLEGRRPARGSDTKALCNSCMYNKDCGYRIRGSEIPAVL